MGENLVGVVLAAGAGSRLAPLSRWRPKALCPVGGEPLVDLALARIGSHVDRVAVNLHHRAAQLDAHLDRSVHRSVEQPQALGTAGALGALRTWVDRSDVMVANADAWLDPALDLTAFVAGWDRRRVRLLCVVDPQRGDFGDLRYCGVALMPWATVAALEPVPSGLYEASWRAEHAAGRLDLVGMSVAFVDCGTPADYLEANLLASGGRSVIDPSAVVAPGAEIRGSVVWDGAEVVAGEVLDRAIRTTWGTVLVR